MDGEVLDRIREARRLIREGRAHSYVAAFRLILEGRAHLPPPSGVEAQLQELRERLSALDGAVKVLLERTEDLVVAYALLRHLKEEVEAVESEVRKVRLVLYGAGLENLARGDADVEPLLGRPPVEREDHLPSGVGRAPAVQPPPSSPPANPPAKKPDEGPPEPDYKKSPRWWLLYGKYFKMKEEEKAMRAQEEAKKRGDKA